MSTPLEDITRQIKQENDRHNMVINDLDRRKNQENTLHQQKIQQLNRRKEQLKRISEQYLNNKTNNITLDEMFVLLEKTAEDF